MNLQITIQGYNEDGSIDKSAMEQGNFNTLDEAKEIARHLWQELKSIHKECFIVEIETGKNMFYTANFK